LKSSVEAFSRESALSSWFCRLARRPSASYQRENKASPTGMSIATAMITHSRRVSPLRKMEL
jgi:hypothetical protein